MSEKKIFVPEEMIKAAAVAYNNRAAELGYKYVIDRYVLEPTLDAALLWMIENPIVPTIEQIWDSYRGCNMGFGVQSENTESVYESGYRHGADWAQRLAFLAPEPVVPEAVKDLLNLNSDPALRTTVFDYNRRILDAYNRGLKAANSPKAEASA